MRKEKGRMRYEEGGRRKEEGQIKATKIMNLLKAIINPEPMRPWIYPHRL